MKVILFTEDGQNEYRGIDKVDQINDVVQIDGITHTGVESLRVVPE
jgi:hypothetical protein